MYLGDSLVTTVHLLPQILGQLIDYKVRILIYILRFVYLLLINFKFYNIVVRKFIITLLLN